MQDPIGPGETCPECSNGTLEQFDNASEHLSGTLVERGGVQCVSCEMYWYEHPIAPGYQA